MLALALILAIAGTAMVVSSALFLGAVHRNSRSLGAGASRPALDAGPILCEGPSPDDALRCTEEVGHWGWHRHAEASWWGDSWGCDHWADTQAAPTEQAPPIAEPPAQPKGTPEHVVPLEVQMPKAKPIPQPPRQPTRLAAPPVEGLFRKPPLTFTTGLFGTRWPKESWQAGRHHDVAASVSRPDPKPTPANLKPRASGRPTYNWMDAIDADAIRPKRETPVPPNVPPNPETTRPREKRLHRAFVDTKAELCFDRADTFWELADKFGKL